MKLVRNAQKYRALRHGFGLLLLGLFLTSCSLNPFCSVQSYTYRETVPVYVQQSEIDKIGSQDPQLLVDPGKIYHHNDLLLVSEIEKGVHVFDNSNPSAPVALAFIAIPGNHDLLVREDAGILILYADNYNNLVTLNITDPRQATVITRLENVFSGLYPQDEADPEKGFLVGYEEGDLVTEHYQTCGGVVPDTPTSPPPSPGSGGDTGGSVSQGGSLARFAMLENFLYTVDSTAVQSFRLEAPDKPVLFNRVNVDFGIETLFATSRESGDQLYVGGNQGLYIMDARDPSNLRPLGSLSHVQSCDPVVVQDDLAYVTLQGSCFNEQNRLEIIDIADPSAPRLVTDYSLQEPFGLGVDGDYLFVCDGAAGLKIYKGARTPETLSLVKQLGDIAPRDVIAVGGLALVVTKNGLYQYDYTGLAEGEMPLLSTIPVEAPK